MIDLREICRNSPNKLGLIFAVLGAIAFGIYPPAARAVYNDGGNAALVIILMTSARGLCMALYCALTSATLFQSREDRKQALIGGALQAISGISIFSSLLYIPGPLVIIIIFSHTIMLLLFMAWRREIKLNFLNATTTLTALLGLTLVLNLWSAQPKGHWIGVALAFTAALVAVGRLYVYGQQTKTRNAIVVGAENFLIAAVLTLPVLFFQTPHLPGSWPGFFWLALTCGSIVFATFCMFFGIAILGAFQYSLMAKLEPIFTALFSVLMLNEALAPYQYAGIFLVVGSLIAYQALSRPRPPARSLPEGDNLQDAL